MAVKPPMIGIRISGIIRINVGDNGVDGISGGTAVDLIIHCHHDHGFDFFLVLFDRHPDAKVTIFFKQAIRPCHFISR